MFWLWSHLFAAVILTVVILALAVGLLRWIGSKLD